MDNIPTSEFGLGTKFLDDILYSIKSGLTVQFNSELKVKNNDLLSSMPLNQYKSLVKQLNEREKYLKQQGIL
jgi:hypothetical protein